jgi:hypothetical protein
MGNTTPAIFGIRQFHCNGVLPTILHQFINLLAIWAAFFDISSDGFSAFPVIKVDAILFSA